VQGERETVGGMKWRRAITASNQSPRAYHRRSVWPHRGHTGDHPGCSARAPAGLCSRPIPRRRGGRGTHPYRGIRVPARRWRPRSPVRRCTDTPSPRRHGCRSRRWQARPHTPGRRKGGTPRQSHIRSSAAGNRSWAASLQTGSKSSADRMRLQTCLTTCVRVDLLCVCMC